MSSQLRELFGDDDRISEAFAADDARLDRFDAEREVLLAELGTATRLPGDRRRLIDVVVDTLQSRSGGFARKDLLNELNRDGGRYPCRGSNVVVDGDRLDVCIDAHPDRVVRVGGSLQVPG
jgi:hypothetical protein